MKSRSSGSDAAARFGSLPCAPVLAVDDRRAPGASVGERPPATVRSRGPSAAGKAVFVSERCGRARCVSIGGWSIALLAAAWILALGAGIPGFLRLPGVRPGSLRVQRDASTPRDRLGGIGHRSSSGRDTRARTLHAVGARARGSKPVADTEMIDYQPPAMEGAARSASVARTVRPPSRAEPRTTPPRPPRRPARRARPQRADHGARRGASGRSHLRPRVLSKGRVGRLHAPGRRPSTDLI